METQTQTQTQTQTPTETVKAAWSRKIKNYLYVDYNGNIQDVQFETPTYILNGEEKTTAPAEWFLPKVSQEEWDKTLLHTMRAVLNRIGKLDNWPTYKTGEIIKYKIGEKEQEMEEELFVKESIPTLVLKVHHDDMIVIPIFQALGYKFENLSYGFQGEKPGSLQIYQINTATGTEELKGEIHIQDHNFQEHYLQVA